MAHSGHSPVASSNSLPTCPLEMDVAHDIWQLIKNKVAPALSGPGVTPVPHFCDAHMFHPLCVIGKQVEGSLPMRKARTLFPLRRLRDLLDPRAGALEAYLQVKEASRCDFIHEEFVSWAGQVRMQIGHLRKEMAVCPLAPHKQLTLRDNLPWLDSVQRLYVVSQTYCSSEARLCVMDTDCKTELWLGPNTPLAFSCIRLSVSPSGRVEVCDSCEGKDLHPRATWAPYGSPEYARLLAGTRSGQPKEMGLLSKLAFRISHPTLLLCRPDSHSQELHSTATEQQELSTEPLLPIDKDDSQGGDYGSAEGR